MIRALVIAALVLGAIYLVYRQGAKDALQGHKTETLRTEKDISDAINSCAELHWFERLRCRD